MIVQKARDYSGYICGNARNKGSACNNKHRISRAYLEKVILDRLKECLLNPPAINEIKSRADKIIRASLSKQRPNSRSLLIQKNEIQKRIENLLCQIENGDIGQIMALLTV